MSEVSLCKRDSYKIRTENEVIVSKTSIVLGRTISVSPDSFRRDADVNLCLSIKYYKIYKFHKYNHKSQEKQGNEREGNGGEERGKEEKRDKEKLNLKTIGFAQSSLFPWLLSDL